MKEFEVIATPNGFRFKGHIHFDNAVSVLEAGKEMINKLPAIEIDLRDLIQSDSSGLAVCTAWVNIANKQNKTLRFACFPNFMKEVIKVYGLDTILPDGVYEEGRL